MNEAKTNLHQTYEEFKESRKKQIGGSDIGKIAGVSRWGCPRSVAYDKLDHPKDFEDDDKPEFRRGRRLEGIAANYYEEITGREVRFTTTARVTGKPHLAINIDRLVYKKDDKERKNPGYLELKTVGRFSFMKVKKEGIPDDWILQVQYGCAVKKLSWGAYGIYCPETDDLLHWDVEADASLGEALLEKADDFYCFHIECRVLPDPLPETSVQCEGCAWSLSCHQKKIAVGASKTFERPDLEGLLAKFAEVKGMGSEAEQAENELKAEIRERIKEVPGTYICGKYEFKFTTSSQNRFSSKKLQAKYPAIYEECREEIPINTVYKPKER